MNIARILNREEDYRALVVGSTGDGKTYCIKFLLPYLARSSNNPGGFTSIYIFGEYVREKPKPNNRDRFFSRYLDFAELGFTVAEEFDPEHLLAWIEQRRIVHEKTGEKSLLVMDDIVKYEFGTGEGKRIIGGIFSSCRHAGVNIITVCHHYTSIPPIARQQANYMIFTSISIDSYTHLIKKNARMKRRISDDVVIEKLSPAKREYLFFDIRAENQFWKFRLS